MVWVSCVSSDQDRGLVGEGALFCDSLSSLLTTKHTARTDRNSVAEVFLQVAVKSFHFFFMKRSKCAQHLPCWKQILQDLHERRIPSGKYIYTYIYIVKISKEYI